MSKIVCGVLAALFVVMVAQKLLTPSAIGDERDPSVAITIATQDGEGWRLEYQFSSAIDQIDLGPSLNGFREQSWVLETEDVELIEKDGRDTIVANPRDRITNVSFKIEPTGLGLKKQYEATTPLGDGHVLYTGQFQPWKPDGKRMDARFHFVAAVGANVTAFDETAPTLRNWRSPFDHPAFVYLGPAQASQSEKALMIVDPQTPEWIRQEFDPLVTMLTEKLETEFEHALAVKPNVFLSYDKDGEPGRLRYSGDALPGQFLIALSGGAWRDDTAAARDLLVRATAHEAAHLWQAQARPSSQAVPHWIHEGAADAIAGEILAAADLWTGERAVEVLWKARDDCAVQLTGRTLAQIEAEGAYGAIYACGHVLASASAGRGRVIDFWREMIAEAQSDGRGYDEALLLQLTAARHSQDLADAVRTFIKTPYPQPAAEMDKLLALAQSRPQ